MDWAERAKDMWGRVSKRNRRRLVFYPSLALAVVLPLRWLTYMPGESYHGPFGPLNFEEELYKADLEKHVRMLGGTIGDRNIARPGTLEKTRDYLEKELGSMNLVVTKQTFYVGSVACDNLSVDIPGAAKAREIVLVGAHYDSAEDAAGADDNGSGVAATLALAKVFRGKTPGRTVRFVLFANEEPPYFWTETMGSVQYARAARARGDAIVAMLSLETIGFYKEEAGTQHYPFPMSAFYGDRGDFIGFVGNTASRGLVHEIIGAFRGNTQFPSEGAALPAFIAGVGWSDQWSFWKEGYAGVMVTDTAPFRNPNYHTKSDLPDTLDYPRFARVVRGLEHVIDVLAR